MGTLSWTLTILSANGALMSALLWLAPGNLAANRFLASLVGFISLRLVVYVIGFAGIYDDHPWITFAPLDASLAFGPLLWLYVVALTRGRPPARWRLHMLPAAAQLGYSLVAFALPLDAKLRWFRGPHLDVFEPLGLGLLLLSGSIYLALAWRRQRGYQLWLDQRYADRDGWRLGWMTAVLASFTVLVGFAALAAAVNFIVTPLDYFGRTPVVVASSLVAYALGLLGWRNSGLLLPSQPLEDDRASPPDAQMSRPALAFKQWARRIAAEGWWREEGLTLGEVARRLGVSQRTLSRGLAEGGGKSFNTLVNDLRVEGVMHAIAAGTHDDLLTIAFDNGFRSKPSFNRAFRQRTGTTPSAWRAASHHPPIVAMASVEATGGA